jgi:predicted phage tail protein
MRAVKVYGKLAERLGQRVFNADVASPAEAVRFLCVNFPGLDQWLIDSAQDGIGYRVMVGKTKVNETDFAMTCSDERAISITPVMAGAGGEFGSIIAGIGLIALSFLLPGAGAFGAVSFFGQAAVAGSFATALGTSISLVGASLVLGGVAGLISPAPQVPGLGASRDPRQLQSFNFSGIQNTSIQGTPIPLVYGKMYVGSVTISAGISTTDI